MNTTKSSILTINGGSSSVRFSVYEDGEKLRPVFLGAIENVGRDHTKLSYTNVDGKKTERHHVHALNVSEAAQLILGLLEREGYHLSFHAVGYRIVYGMNHTRPEVITPELLKELNAISAYDPEHMPGELELIDAFQKRYPTLMHVACFDTAFHAKMPKVAKWISIPRRFQTAGVQRYGFHGLSYAYLMYELEHIAGPDAANGKVILVHLGNGASLAAVDGGKSMDTSMGFTPTAGIPMGTRSGDLDPGVAWYLMQVQKLTPEQFNHLVNHESGMLGISETTSDMRELLEKEDTDVRAAEAIEFFCYQIKKWIGSFAAALGGLDTLVFTGGIGEHAPQIRERICNGLQFLGITLDTPRNLRNEEIISVGRIQVRVIKTNEELMIARLVKTTLNS